MYIYIYDIYMIYTYTYTYTYLNVYILKYKIEKLPLDDSDLKFLRSKGTLRQSLEILDNAPTVIDKVTKTMLDIEA